MEPGSKRVAGNGQIVLGRISPSGTEVTITTKLITNVLSYTMEPMKTRGKHGLEKIATILKRKCTFCAVRNHVQVNSKTYL